MKKNKQRFYFLWLTLIIIAVFILQLSIKPFTELFMLSENALTMPWQFITAIFLHGGAVHLIYNLFALLIFGLILEQLIGSRRFLALFFAAGIIANIISFFWYPNALGASGAIMGIIGCLAILRPMMSVWAFGMILPMFIVAILWITGSIMGMAGFGSQGVGHLAHLLGILTGLSYGIWLKIRSKKNKRLVYMRQIRIPETTARNWEDIHMR